MISILIYIIIVTLSSIILFHSLTIEYNIIPKSHIVIHLKAEEDGLAGDT